MNIPTDPRVKISRDSDLDGYEAQAVSLLDRRLVGIEAREYRIKLFFNGGLSLDITGSCDGGALDVEIVDELKKVMDFQLGPVFVVDMVDKQEELNILPPGRVFAFNAEPGPKSVQFFYRGELWEFPADHCTSPRWLNDYASLWFPDEKVRRFYRPGRHD